MSFAPYQDPPEEARAAAFTSSQTTIHPGPGGAGTLGDSNSNDYGTRIQQGYGYTPDVTNGGRSTNYGGGNFGGGDEEQAIGGNESSRINQYETSLPIRFARIEPAYKSLFVF